MAAIDLTSAVIPMQYAPQTDQFCPWCNVGVRVNMRKHSWVNLCFNGANACTLICFPLELCFRLCNYRNLLLPGTEFHCSNCSRLLALQRITSKVKGFSIPIGEDTITSVSTGLLNPLYTRWLDSEDMRVLIAKECTHLLTGMALRRSQKFYYQNSEFQRDLGCFSYKDAMRVLIVNIWTENFTRILKRGFSAKELDARIEDAWWTWRCHSCRLFTSTSEFSEKESPWVIYLAGFLAVEFGLGPEMMRYFTMLRQERNVKLASLSEYDRLEKSMSFAVLKVMT